MKKYLYITIPLILLVVIFYFSPFGEGGLRGIYKFLFSNFYFLNSSPDVEASAPKTGLVGWWTMDANDINGTTYYDKSGRNNTATSTAAPTLAIGRINQSLSFNSSSQFIAAPDSSILRPTTVSVAAWFKTGSTTANMVLVNKPRVSGAYGAYILYVNSTAGKVTFILDGSPNIINSNLTINDNKWHHVVGLTDGVNCRLYVDGVADATAISCGNPTYTNNLDLQIGRFDSGAGQYFNGSIDDVRVYNRALSAAEVAQLYSSAKTTYTASAPKQATSTSAGRLVGWWTMDSNDMSTTGATLYDRSGQNNHGTVTGTTTSTGRISQSRTFNGTTDQIQTNSFTIPIYPMTLSAWVKLDATSAAQGIATYGDAGGGGQENGIIVVSGNYWALSQNNIAQKALSAASAGIWQHIVGVFTSATSRKLYIDGIFKSEDTTSITPAPTTPTVKIGNRTATNQYLDGAIDDVRVYNYAMSAQEISNLYSSAKTKYLASAPKTGLVGWWTMDTNDINGTTVYDKSGQNNNGTLTDTLNDIGKINQARNCPANPSDQMTTNKSFSTFASASDGTFALWVKPRGSPSTAVVYQLPAIMGDTTGGYFGISRGIDSTLLTDRIWAYNYDTNTDQVGVTYNINEWVHIAWVHTGGNLYIYKNGVLGSSVASGNTGVITGVVKFCHAVGASYFNGSLDDVRVYNRALSAAEVANLYNSARTSYK